MKTITQNTVCAVVTTCIAFTGLTVAVAMAAYQGGFKNGSERRSYTIRQLTIKDVMLNQRIDVRAHKIIVEYDGEIYEYWR